MGKKSKRNRPSKQQDTQRGGSSEESPPKRSNAGSAQRQGTEGDDNDLKFQDPTLGVEDDAGEDDDEDIVWEDEDDDDSNAIYDNDEEEDDDGGAEIIQAWHPFSEDPMPPPQQLEMDPSAYKMYHALTAEWPSLSFDFLRDEKGESRTRFPHSLICAVGTQADRANQNELVLMKLSDLSKMPQENDDDILGEEYDPEKFDKKDDDDDSDSESEVDLDPVMESFSIPHFGGVNRVRTMPQQSSIIATWSDAGKVNVFNAESILQRFSASEGKFTDSSMKDIPKKAYFPYAKHSTEGYALDWSPVKQGHLATGDCNGGIHLWTPRPEGGYEVVPSYDTSTLERATGVTGANSGTATSVEDLQWSPTEGTVFSTAECGGYVRIFDTRAPKRSMLNHKIHSNGADVNVLSWNKLVQNLLATGGDDGVLSVWDLRHFSSGGDSTKKVDPLARFTPHKTPITSVEWHPTDESMLAVSDDHGAYIYDLSVEEDDAAAIAAAQKLASQEVPDVPPQLLFVHCGSEQFKEVHWHPQISSCLMTTALSGYSVFIPSNL